MPNRSPARWTRYGGCLILFATTTMLRYWLDPVLEDSSFIIYFANLVITGWLWGLGPSLLAVLLSLVVSALYFGPPPGAPPEPLAKVLAGLSLFFFVGMTTALLSESMRSAQRRVESQLAEAERQREQLREADRHKDDFLAMLGHELRNPLAGITGAVQVLEAAGEPRGEHADMRIIIHRQATQLVRLIDDLLDVSRISRGKLQLETEPLDLSALVESTVRDFRLSRNGGDLDIRVELPAEPVWTMGDRTRLTQVIVNLLHNADKFSLRGGALHVALVSDRASQIAELTVRDFGVGIDPRILAHIFEPFRQAEQGLERRHGGLGLGLALAKGLVELHGGQIAAFSGGPNQGAEFTIRLPLTESGGPSVPSPAQCGARKKYRILIIEDQHDAALPLQALLKQWGHQVELAHDGRTGLHVASAQKPDIVLCDIGLPIMDGYEVAASLRQDPATRSIYLVAITGYGRDTDRQRAMGAGFNQHLAKPVSAQQLQSLLADFTSL